MRMLGRLLWVLVLAQPVFPVLAEEPPMGHSSELRTALDGLLLRDAADWQARPVDFVVLPAARLELAQDWQGMAIHQVSQEFGLALCLRTGTREGGAPEGAGLTLGLAWRFDWRPEPGLPVF